VSLNHVTVVLSRPSEPRNIGATCRAMRNAGLDTLIVASGREIDVSAARPLAVGAVDVLDSMQVVPTLEDAIASSALVAGVTRRTGKRRKTVSFSPWQVAARATAEPRGPVALVFGNEQSGLSDTELELCHMAVSIPACPDFPSLNLSHAVQIICYELYLADIGWPAASRKTQEEARPPDAGFLKPAEISAGVERIVSSLATLGFLTQEGPQGMPALLREILGRAMVSRRELDRLAAMFGKLAGMHTTPGIGPPEPRGD
jgi:tRNA/rRNA methyltransferase